MMSTFLFILLALVLSIAVVVPGGFFWFRRKLKRTVGDYRLFAPYVIAPTARLTLREEAHSLEPDGGKYAHIRAMSQLRTMLLQLEAQGFVDMGTYAADEDNRVMAASQHPDSGIVGLAIYIPGKPPFFECLTLSPSKQVSLLSGEPDARTLQLPSLSVEACAALTPAEAIKALAGSPGQPLDKPTLIMLLERVHAARMDCVLTAVPTLGEMEAHGAKHGGATLNEEQRVRALELNRDSWADAVRVALLDNGRRKLKLDAAAWETLKEDLVIVHEAMGADEVIAKLAHHPLVDKLGDQLKRQNFTPVQIFDEINQRLGADDQLGMAVRVKFPVRARLFAPSSALRTAGLLPEEAPA